MTKLEKALEQALRWKIALDAANKGARRKSRQARAWRARAERAEAALSVFDPHWEDVATRELGEHYREVVIA